MPQFTDSIEYTNTKRNKVTLDGITNVSTVDASTLSVANAREAQHAVNADNAANATNITTNINGKAISSIFEDDGTTVRSATKAGAIEQADTRESNKPPNYYHAEAQWGKNFIVEFKDSALIGLSGQSKYCQLITFAKWTDASGGNLTQVAVVDNNFFIRMSTGSTGWGEWQKLLKVGEAGAVETTENAINIIPDAESGAVNPLGRKDGATVGTQSTAFGYNSTASAESSVALGRESNASGGASTAIGSTASASGTRSTALGYNSAAKNNYSIALGDGSVAGSDTAEYGNGSIALGYNSTASGTSSIALGSNPDESETGATASGNYSIALGSGANASSGWAIALGYGANASLNSMALGYNATTNASIASVALGYEATVSSSELATMRLGGSSLRALVSVASLTKPSDKRDKTDIEGITDALAFLERLNPVTFVNNNRVEYISDEDKKGENYRTYGMCEYDRVSHAAGTKKGERRRCGLIAQEVIEAMQSVYGTDNYADIVNDNFHDLAQKPSDVENKYTLAYSNLVPFLIGAVKELNAKIKALESKLATSSVADVQED